MSQKAGKNVYFIKVLKISIFLSGAVKEIQLVFY